MCYASTILPMPDTTGGSMNLKIQIVIAGYGGEPVTLVASLDNNGILVVVKDIAYREEKVSHEFSLVSNLDLPQTDFRFDDKDLRNTIRSYFTRIAQETLILNNPVARFRPDNKIERDTVDERGQRYRIAPDINSNSNSRSETPSQRT